MKVHKVFAKKNAIWPFTVVGRPPQEDTSFGHLIHEMTGTAVQAEIPGLREVHAVDAAGVHPVSLGPLPDPIAKLALIQAGVQQLAVEAAVHASKELALQALLADPVINSSDAAVKLLDELWEINKPYIRKCV